MKLRTWTLTATIYLLSVALGTTPSVVAQDKQTQNSTRKHHHYKVIEIGTFGGPTSSIAGAPSRVLTEHGTVIGWADLKAPDPFNPNCFSSACTVQNSFIWHDERLTELPSLASAASSVAFWENDRRWVVGTSETGSLDPALGTPQYSAVLWRDGVVKDLGTLGGASSVANAVNNYGEVVGGASNGIADDHSMLNSNTFGYGPFPANTESHAFVWVDGYLFDLGTLGGSDSMALFNNDKGQVAGISYPDNVPVPGFGGFPGTVTFLWQNGQMKDIGGLGGHSTFPRWLNNRGEIVGTSNLKNDADFPHAFLWDGNSARDLGTLGGEWSTADFITENGLITGYSETVPGKHALGHPYLWRDGKMLDLGPPRTGFNCAAGASVNLHAQVVGGAGCNVDGLGYPFIWEIDNPIVDLNTLLVPETRLQVQEVISINDRGEIACQCQTSNGDARACLLVPLGDDEEWYDEATAGISSSLAIKTTEPTIPGFVPNHASEDKLIRSLRNGKGHRYRVNTPAAAPIH